MGGTRNTGLLGADSAGEGDGEGSSTLGAGEGDGDAVGDDSGWVGAGDSAAGEGDEVAGGGGGGAFLCFGLDTDSTLLSCFTWNFLGTGGSKPTKGPPC